MNHKDASLKIRDFDLRIKALGDDGAITGYGSVFGVTDSYKWWRPARSLTASPR